MDVAFKLMILRSAGMLSEQNEKNVCNILAYLEHEEGLLITEESGGGFITHLCSALERCSNGEDVAPLEDVVFEDCRQQPQYKRAKEAAEKIAKTSPCLPPEELRYLILHLVVLFAGAET